MSDAIVIYKSTYGSTAKYAKWIAQELGCEAVELRKLKASTLGGYNRIIYGGGIYAGKIIGCKSFLKNWDILKTKRVAVFAVGMSDLQDKAAIDKVAASNLSAEYRDSVRFFCFRSGIDYPRLKFMHKSMMQMMVSVMRKQPDSAQTDASRFLIDTYGSTVDLSDKSYIAPLVEYMRA